MGGLGASGVPGRLLLVLRQVLLAPPTDLPAVRPLLSHPGLLPGPGLPARLCADRRFQRPAAAPRAAVAAVLLEPRLPIAVRRSPPRTGGLTPRRSPQSSTFR